MSVAEDRGRTERRLIRERTARLEAERIAEDATRRLHVLVEDLRRTNAHLERLQSAQRDFIAVASHELRTPIVPIVGFVSVLLDEWESLADETRLSYVHAINRQAQRLSRLADTLLTTSRLDSGFLSPRIKEIELQEAVEKAVAALEEHASLIEVECPSGLIARGDPDHLEEILINYLANAVRYGRPPFRVNATRNSSWVELRVQDSGDGVPGDLVPRIFEKFASVDRSASGSGGVGLGLYIVSGLARVQSGEAWYEPGVPSGACFGLRLPAVDHPV